MVILYDAAGNTSLTYLTINNGTTTTYDMFTQYTYNQQNMVTALQRFDLADGTAAGLISGFSGTANTVTPSSVTYSYDANGNMTQLNRYSDLANTQLVASTAYSYNALNAPTAITTTINTASSPSTQSYSYSYDLGGRLTQQITPDGTSNFTYDHDNQLLTDSTGSGSYSYDSNGNRTSTNGVSSTVGANNQITSSGSGGYTYDAAGNLTAVTCNLSPVTSTTYSWNSLNLLTQVVTKNSAGTITLTVAYAYNTKGQRISQIVTNASGTVTLNQRYIYDGDNLLAVLNVDPTTGAATVAQRFLMGPNENQILAQENAGANSSAGPVLWAITDNNGSVVDVVNNGGGNAVLDHIVYDSFGNITSQTDNNNAMLMRFDGYQYDSLTGLYYANARYYSPQLGRFISQDPSGFSAGDSNLYRFVGNHPTYATDPTGLYEGGSTGGLTAAQWSAAGQIVNNAAGGSWSTVLPGSGNTYTGSSPVSLTSPSSAFGGNGPITAPTSSGESSGFGGSGSYGSGSNSIAFNLGSGPSNQSLPTLASAVYAPMGAGPMPGLPNIPTAASSAAYMQNLSQQYAPSLLGSTTLGSAAYSIGQSEVNGAVNAWNYTTSGIDALAHNPSALGLGIPQGLANLGTTVDNIGISLANSVIAGSNLLNTGINAAVGLVDHGAAPFSLAAPIPYATAPQFFADPAHNVEMGLNNLGITGLSAGAGAVGEAPAAAESAAVRTNAELVQEVGTRADAWATRKGLTGTPQQLGTWEHTYAESLLNRYQSMFGDRGLVTEKSFLGGAEVPYGTAGSVRLDVRDINTGAVWDYKFGAGGLTPAQRLRIITNGPNVTSVTEVRP